VKRRSWWRTCLVVLWAVVSVIGLVGSGWTVRSWVAVPSSVQRLVAEGERLLAVTADGSPAPGQMQAYFPEGEFFTYVLAGTGLARLADPELYPSVDEQTRAAFLAGARHALDAISTDQVSTRFGQISALDHGIFYRGWRLALINAIVASGGSDLAAEQASEARAILQAVGASQAGWVEGYPGGYWPCDTVAGLGAAAAALPGEAAEVVQRWMNQVVPDDTGLLPHQVRADGSAMDLARGTSQAIIQTFWPSLSAVAKPGNNLEDWTTFTNRFISREAGVVAVREWPQGVDGAADVDSGPLIAGLSLSASAVGLAAARANGDTALAADLDHEIEWLAVGITSHNQRTYGAGLLPVAEAFIFWAKTTPVGMATSDTSHVSPVWWAWALVFALPAVLFVVIIPWRKHRQHTKMSTPWAQDKRHPLWDWLCGSPIARNPYCADVGVSEVLADE